jgi:transcriptional regulator with XRE-family HTH domain
VAQRHKTLADYFAGTPKQTRAVLAAKLGVDVSYISHLIAGRKQPSLGLALEIHRLTGVPLASLIREHAA